MLAFPRLPLRAERLATELENCALDAEALARRMAASEGLTPDVRQHAEKVAAAAHSMCLATVAMRGQATPGLRLAFGRHLGASLLGEVDDI